MPTINITRQGSGLGAVSSNFNTARTGNAASVVDGVTGNQSNVVQYFQSSGRGGGTIRFKRVFLYFDTSGITGTLSAAHIDVSGYSGAGTGDNTGLLKSSAFGGDGGTALATTDFYTKIDYGTIYSSLSSFSTGNNEYTLSATALADIKNNDHFTLAIVELRADYGNTDIGNAALDISIAFSTTITLDYTLQTGYGNDVNGVAAASIGKVNGVATANIEKINGI